MRIEQISIKTLITSILLFLAFVALILSLVAGLYFREAALQAQAISLSRIIKIGSDDAIQKIQKESAGFGAAFHSREAVRNALNTLKETGHAEQLITQLNDSFVKGFAGMAAIDLVKLRVYDINLILLCESSEGLAGLAPQLPAFLHTRASGRKGVERMKALNGLWISPAGPLHSMLFPLGGIHLSGYLEVVVNPNFNLGKIATLTQMPLNVYSADGTLVYQSAHNKTSDQGIQLPVEYLLKTENGELAYRMVGLEDVTQFNNDMRKTQGFLSVALLMGGAILLALTLWTLTRFVFRPISHMMDDIKRYSVEGKLTVTTNQGNVKEFHALSDAFSDMANKIQGNIHDLERLSWLDGLTGVANRRCLDIGLDREWRRAQREKSEISLLLIDIDFFKLYNDHFGHQGGDDCLKAVATALAQIVSRPGDLAARYGGEEFAVLLPATSSEGAVAVASLILEAIRKLNIAHPESTVSNILTISLGVSTLVPSAELSPFHLIGFADEALYQAKESGRNQIKIAHTEATIGCIPPA